jgi:hypothetical protein
MSTNFQSSVDTIAMPYVNKASLNSLGSQVHSQYFCMKCRSLVPWSIFLLDKTIVAQFLVKSPPFNLRWLGANFSPLRLGFSS